MSCTSHKPEMTQLVRLVDGREVCSCSNEWRLECHARTILALPLAERREHLARFGSKRGERARMDLELVMVEIWKAERRGGKAA